MWLRVAFGWRFTPAPPGFYPGRPCWKCRVTRLTRHGCSVWFCRLAGVLDGANGFSFPKPRAPRILLTHLLQVCPRVCNSRPLVSLGSRRSSEPHDREALQPGLPCSVRQEASVCRPRPPLSLNLRGSWVCTYLRAEGACLRRPRRLPARWKDPAYVRTELRVLPLALPVCPDSSGPLGSVSGTRGGQDCPFVSEEVRPPRRPCRPTA